MIIVLSWEQFKPFLNGDFVFVEETEDKWILIRGMTGNIQLKCNVAKSDDTEKNIMFVEKYLSNNPNLFKAMAIKETETKELIIRDVMKEEPYSNFAPADVMSEETEETEEAEETEVQEDELGQ